MPARPLDDLPGFDCVAIIGTGLVGGSILRDTLARTPASVRTWDIDASVAPLVAEALGVHLHPSTDVDGSALPPRLHLGSSLADALEGADLVILAAPVSAIIELAAEIPPLVTPGAVVTDVGSVKAPIVAALETAFAGTDASIVAGHPMAGREVSGFASSIEGLFTAATWALTISRDTDLEQLDRVGSFVSSLGAQRIISCDPRLHDEMVAAVSHLPQLVASALSATISDADDLLPGTMELTGTGYRDTTRIAASDPGMWEEIVAVNARAILPLLDTFTERATSLRDAVAAEDWPAVRALIAAGRAGRARMH